MLYKDSSTLIELLSEYFKQEIYPKDSASISYSKDLALSFA